MYKKIAGLFAIICLTLGLSTVVFASEPGQMPANIVDFSINTHAADHEYVNIVQSALDGVGMPIIPFSYFGCIDSLNSLVDNTFYYMLYPVREAINEITVAVGTDALKDNPIFIRDVFYHPFFTNIHVNIKVCGSSGFILESLTYSVSFEPFMPSVQTLGEYVDFQPLNPYNMSRSDIRDVMDPVLTTQRVATITNSIRYFQRIDRAIFVDVNSHATAQRVTDSRLLQSISLNSRVWSSINKWKYF